MSFWCGLPFVVCWQRYRLFMDAITPWVIPRWVFCVVSLLLFMARIVLVQVGCSAVQCGAVWWCCWPCIVVFVLSFPFVVNPFEQQQQQSKATHTHTHTHMLNLSLPLPVVRCACILLGVMWQGWYIVAYALGIYLLNLLLAFLTPRFDPAISVDTDSGEGDEDAALPTKQDEEFRPFVRRLPEWKFWFVHTPTASERR